jgi:hypothetical protein
MSGIVANSSPFANCKLSASSALYH